MDFARKRHLSVFLPLTIGQDLVRREAFTLTLRNVPFDQQQQVVWHCIRRLPRFCGGALDAGGNGMWLAEVTAAEFGGSLIHQIQLNQQWYAVNMPPFKKAYEDRALLMTKDADHVKDLQQIKVDYGIPKVPADAETLGADGKPRHGDYAVAGCLAWFASVNRGAPMDAEGLGQPRESARYFPDLPGGELTDTGWGTVAGDSPYSGGGY